MAFDAADEMMAGDFAALTAPRWAGEEGNMNNEQSRLYRLLTEPAAPLGQRLQLPVLRADRRRRWRFACGTPIF